jgi:hypothetical protein
MARMWERRGEGTEARMVSTEERHEKLNNVTFISKVRAGAMLVSLMVI